MALVKEDLRFDIPRGIVNKTTGVNKFGSNPTSAADTEEEVWSGSAVYVYPINVFATGTVTAATAIVDDNVVIDGLIYTAVAGVPSDFTFFSIDTGNNETATSLAAAINGDTRTTDSGGTLSASPSSAIVTITTSLEGTPGNAVALLTSDGATLVISGALFTGGVFEVITKLSQTVDQAALRGGSIEVEGLDVNWDLVTQVVALDGTLTTTAVSLTTALIRVNRMRVLANVVIDSPVRAHNTAESQDYATILAGKNQTQMALYTVARNKTAYMTNFFGDYVRSAAQDPNGVEFDLYTRDMDNGYEFQLKHSLGVPKQASGFQQKWNPYLMIEGKHDIKVTATASDFAGHVHSGFDLILVDD